ncbi:MAG: response regulator transcription factor [Deltaproteobacteria bacterium]|nr:response regulator transcription factor [Deltaproteobacteria bacterium]
MRILLVEDDRNLGDAVAEELREELYAVDLARDGDTAAELMIVNEYDGVILDRNIPPPTGLELLRRWRQEGSLTPVLVLTARSSMEDRVGGLDAGADDYLAKPFEFTELKARVRSLVRRSARPATAWLRAGDLAMNPDKRRVQVADFPLRLSAREFDVLEYLLRHQGAVVPRARLLEKVWEVNFDPMTNVVEVFIHRLRSKVGKLTDQKLIQTVKGVGYRLAVNPG